MNSLLVSYLAYFGPNRKPASLKLEPGLNVVCGASDTGKSIIVESIDFMLGQEEPVRDVPERAGYDRIRLVLGQSDHPFMTLDRSVEGGNFLAFEEIVFDGTAKTEPHILRSKHAATRTDTLSYALLNHIGFSGKVLRLNAAGKTRSLSFRDIARLCVVTEDKIQGRGSPALSGQWVKATSEYAAFKLLLTGSDDSALVSVPSSPAKKERDVGKIELLDQMIEELQLELDEAGEDEGELKEQEQRLTASLDERTRSLKDVQQQFNSLMSSRTDAAQQLRKTKARLLEIDELLGRFSLLDKHYETDLERLKAIHESGTLLVHMESKPCPLCGALPGDQHLDADCEGNTEAIVHAASVEINKIARLRIELAGTLSSLRDEHAELNGNYPSLKESYNTLELRLNEITAPAVSKERASYDELMSELSSVRSSLDKIANLQKFIQRRANIEGDAEGGDRQKHETKTQISKSVLDEFAQEIQQILEDWEYPNASRVFFDEAKKDIQISGKERGSTGKGLRAITHAAFTIGLMQFCLERRLPHPGFVVLDSPLLAYWKPEGKDDDLRGTNLKDNFYRYLLGMSKDNQIIIIENEHPPSFIEQGASVTVFTKNPNVGRYGFFPLS